MIDDAFWKKFARTYWEKRAGRFKGIRSPVQTINSRRVFKWLVAYSNHCRKTKTVVGMKLYIDGRGQYKEEVLELLPVAGDRTLKGYHRRMDASFSDYCLVCDRLMDVARGESRLVKAFTAGLYEQVKSRIRLCEVGLYLGNYHKTPFGVHVDGCAVLSFPVEGTKRFRVWTPEYVKRHPRIRRAHDYDRFKKGSKRLTADKGDMVYWPSKYWHIAESGGTFSATWSLGFWL